MEVATVGQNSIRLKGKQATFIIDPFDKKIKSPADATVLLTNDRSVEPTVIEESRVVIEGAGDFEVAGVKFAGTRVKNDIVYDFRLDGLRVLVGTMPAVKAAQDKVTEPQVLIIKTDGEIEQSVITALSPQLLVLFGDGVSQENVKSKGFDTVSSTNKVVTTSDKLPQEMEVVVLQ
jgi:hypothetical protein